MDISELDKDIFEKIEKIKSHHGKEEAQQIEKAFRYALEAHGDQKRRSGEPYIVHPVETAVILDDLGLDVDSIVAGLLHDCIEDTPATFQIIEKEFGESVANLVEGVTKLGKIVYSSKEEEQMEDLRKMFIAMAKDIRVIIIKLADRLHNARTFQYLPPQKQREKSLETMEIYAPLAHRLGMQNVKWELEDLSLKYLDPVGYAEITGYLDERKVAFNKFLETVQSSILQRLEQAGISCRIKARLKHVYSLYRKMYGQNLTFSEIYDICAVRVIVHDIADCYNVLGLIHDMYRPVPGRFKDYISTPKPNGYQSLHTVVIGREGIPFEVQIRTEDMDQSAEYGIAAHWKYKDGLSGKQKEEAFAWVRQLLESQQDSDAEDFIKNIKVDLFADEVFVFTPKGNVINLPQGAIPIDFAYAIHSAVGNRMTGAKVNGRIVPIDYTLKSGEIVDIITSKTTNGPKRDWLKMVKTAEARNKIKQWFKKECREENIERGRADLERELRTALLYDDFQSEDVQTAVLKRLNFPSLEELYASIGYGGVMVSRVIIKVKEEVTRLNREKHGITKPVVQKPKAVGDTGVIVEGLDNCLVKFAKCCTPIPGDSIVGFITRGYGISIHRTDCPNVLGSMKKEEEAGRWIRTEWDYSEKHKYQTGLRIYTQTRVGILADVITVFSNAKVNVNELSARDDTEGHSILYITVTVSGREQLEFLMNRIRRCPGVVDVKRNINETGSGK